MNTLAKADLLERMARLLAEVVDVEADCRAVGLVAAEREVQMAETFLGHAKQIVLEALRKQS